MPRARHSRAGRVHTSTPELVIPDRLYFRIGEVSELTQTEPYVLRYWETEFPSLKPVKSRSGHRLYRRKDIEMVLQIKHLLYDDGLTIKGARKHLAENSGGSAEKSVSRPALDGLQLKAIKRELQAILTTLSRKC